MKDPGELFKNKASLSVYPLSQMPTIRWSGVPGFWLPVTPTVPRKVKSNQE